jgi:hypothetical protein
LLGATPSAAKPVEYVRVCDIYGVGWYYIPGTATCFNVATGETREETENGTAHGQSGSAAQVQQLFEGVALGLALPTPVVAPGDRFAISASWGQFEGSHALGFGAALRLGDGVTLNASVGVGLGQGTVGSSIGIDINW